MNDFNELFHKIENWSHERNIINGCSSADQYMKLCSEFSDEVAAAIYSAAEIINNVAGEKTEKGKQACLDDFNAHVNTELADAIGDSIVVLTNIAAQEGFFIGDLFQQEPLNVNWDISHAPFLLTSIALGRLGDSIKKRNKEDIKTYITMMLSGLESIAHQFDQDVYKCVLDSYLEIEPRKGVMYNGIFVKSDDANYERICAEIENSKKVS